MSARAFAILGVLALLAAAPAAAQEPRTTLPDVEDEVMCPICGTLLELSESPQAERQRALIRDLIAEGRTKEEIKDVLVAEYGEEVLAVPDDEGFDLSAWIVPIAAILLAIAGIAIGLRRWSRPGADAEPADEALEPAESARLERDLSSYDL